MTEKQAIALAWLAWRGYITIKNVKNLYAEKQNLAEALKGALAEQQQRPKRRDLKLVKPRRNE